MINLPFKFFSAIIEIVRELVINDKPQVGYFIFDKGEIFQSISLPETVIQKSNLVLKCHVEMSHCKSTDIKE